jgi:hypothetical protein
MCGVLPFEKELLACAHRRLRKSMENGNGEKKLAESESGKEGEAIVSENLQFWLISSEKFIRKLE